MNIGSLYRVKQWYWLLFPSKELADDPRHGGVKRSASAAEFWSKKYNENVTWFPPETHIVFLEQDRSLKKVLTSEGLIGWIEWFEDADNHFFEEVKSE